VKDASVSARGGGGGGHSRAARCGGVAVWPQKVKRIVDRSTAVPPMKGACQATG